MSSDAPAAQSVTSIRGVPVRQSPDRFLSLFTEIRNGEGMLGFCVSQYAAINIFFALIWIGIVTVITREHKKLSAPA